MNDYVENFEIAFVVELLLNLAAITLYSKISSRFLFFMPTISLLVN